MSSGQIEVLRDIETDVRGRDVLLIDDILESGAPLLAVSGEVVNVTDMALPVPALRFVLRDGSGNETYAWTLDGVGTRTVEPGEATSFLTRVAAPPAHVEDVEIRFARGD